MPEATIAIGVLYIRFLQALGFTHHRLADTCTMQHTHMSRACLVNVLIECHLVLPTSTEEEVDEVINRLCEEGALRRADRADSWRLTKDGVHWYRTDPHRILTLRIAVIPESTLLYAAAE